MEGQETSISIKQIPSSLILPFPSHLSQSQHLSLPIIMLLSTALDPFLLPCAPVSNTHELQSQFNHQLTATSGTDE